MLLRPTRVRAKPVRFHISAHGYAKNLTSFRRKPLSQDISGRMQYAPTRVRAKFGRFHIPPPEYAQNLPGFIFPHTDTPKTHPVLGPNLRRKIFGAYAFAPLHGYVQNPPGFIFPHTDTPKTHPISPSPIGIHRKRTRF